MPYRARPTRRACPCAPRRRVREHALEALLWGIITAAFVVLLVWVRLLKPAALRGRPWRLVGVGHEPGRTTTLALRPPDGERFRFDPGQFAWFAFDRSPFSLTLHPFSFSSSAESDEVEIAVKALGDFTSRVHELGVGTTVYADGPHGVFSMDQDEGPGFGFVAGGVDIAGLLSKVRTMADRGDVRPPSSSNRTATGTASRSATNGTARGAHEPHVVHVLERPPADGDARPAT